LLEKLIEYNFSAKITCMFMLDDLLSMVFADGKIETFKIEIENIEEEQKSTTAFTSATPNINLLQ
jgi:hypothetical protein